MSLSLGLSDVSSRLDLSRASLAGIVRERGCVPTESHQVSHNRPIAGDGHFGHVTEVVLPSHSTVKFLFFSS